MKFVVILAALIAVSYETTAPQATTHESNEAASIFFYYDYLTHKMALRYGRTCYIFTLTDQQRTQVHTDAGIKALELTLLPLIDSGHKTLVQKSSLSTDLQRACGRNTTLIYTMS
ncbi:hypothetical protein ACJMK2_014810 [Sinanodonta woodiana]|uniref:Uncharacterized protein n=1 Tax=Sinanodonta woodiana TaxID=1069815 RepID=A0ABD3V4J7_SINWO